MARRAVMVFAAACATGLLGGCQSGPPPAWSPTGGDPSTTTTKPPFAEGASRVGHVLSHEDSGRLDFRTKTP